MSDEPDLAKLETSVKAAATQLKKLREENRSLRRDLKQVQEELSGQRDAAGTLSSDQASTLRQRLEGLEGHLEALLS